jgi:tRNA threonylcarbamoyladenosine biosynthesis protein TsaE
LLQTVQLISNSNEETKEISRCLAKELKAGDVICLSGDLGAGKTVFTQGLAQGLGVKNKVTSPTFTIIHEYQGRLPLFHLDLYRLNSEAEIEKLGLDEYFFSSGISVVEWGEKAKKFLPTDYLSIEIFCSKSNQKRRLLKFQSKGKRGAELLKAILSYHG